jgi:hypothetical protein
LLYFRDGGLPRILIPPRFGYSQSPSAIHPDLLLGYDGEEVLETGKGDYTPQYSVLATGVTRFVSEHMNKDKYSPIWTRFLWAQLSYPGARYLSDDKPKYSVHETIVEFYRRAASLPAVNYVLTHKSGKLFCDACNKLQNEMVLSPDIGMRTAFDYAPGNLARLIGNCHIIHELAEGKDVPTSEISLSRVQQGVRLIYLFLEQLKQIYSY